MYSIFYITMYLERKFERESRSYNITQTFLCLFINKYILKINKNIIEILSKIVSLVYSILKNTKDAIPLFSIQI